MSQNTIISWFESVVARHGSKTAITFLRNGQVETEVTFNELQRDVYTFAATLLDLGVQKGDRVILFMPKSLIAVVAHFAVQAIGAMAVPLNPGFKKTEMEYLLKDADARLIILDSGKIEMVQEICPRTPQLALSSTKKYQKLEFFRTAAELLPTIDINPDDPALIIYTSGTTGNPKGTLLTHRNLVYDASNIMNIWEISAHDVLCHALPLFHVHGLCFALHTALLAGAHVRMIDQFEPESVIAELSRNTGSAICSIFMAVPAMYAKLMDYIGTQQLDFSHMRLFTSGSAPLLVKEFDRISDIFGLKPVEREGMSETGMNFSNPLNDKRIPGSIGIPLPGLQVRIVNPETFVDTTPGETGELWLRSTAITPGYWRKPQETADTFKDGWFRTGDLGRVDANGYYYLTDRIKHIIISGGENVSAKEVETILNQFEGIDESVVVGKPDGKWGERVVAAVTLEPGAEVTEKEIKAFCREHLHDWKCPREFIFLDRLPRNTMGKVLKEEVKMKFLSSSTWQVQ